MLNLGQMRHTVTIERRSSAQTASGMPKLEWVLVAQRRAAVEAAAGREVWAAQQQAGRIPTVFRLRWLSGVLPSMRLTWDSRLFDIVSAVDPDGRRTELVITALEQVGEAVPA